MKMKKNESTNDEEAYKYIKDTFGAKVEAALRKYCELKKKDPNAVAFDTSKDGAGNTAWDKFDVWARSKGLDIMENLGSNSLDDFIDDPKSSARKRATARCYSHSLPEYDIPFKGDMYKEGSGSKMEENDILDWIFQEMGECEWAEDMEYQDEGNSFEVSMPGPDGDVFRVSVQKVWSGRLGRRLD